MQKSIQFASRVCLKKRIFKMNYRVTTGINDRPFHISANDYSLDHENNLHFLIKVTDTEEQRTVATFRSWVSVEEVILVKQPESMELTQLLELSVEDLGTIKKLTDENARLKGSLTLLTDELNRLAKGLGK